MVENIIPVEVAYALPGKQKIIALDVPGDTGALDAVKLSGIERIFPQINSGEELSLGIFGKVCAPDTKLHPYDRVEIYRPLIADPREVRRQRAKSGKKMRKGTK